MGRFRIKVNFEQFLYEDFHEEMTMKAALALSLALIISGCATTSEQIPSEDGDKSTQVWLPELHRSPDAWAGLSPAADKIPVLVVSGANNAIEFRGQRSEPVRLVEKDQIVSISSDYAKLAPPIIIAIDASRVREQKYLTDPILKEVRTEVSMAERPNPDYGAAQEAVRKAESELRTAENEDKEAQQQVIPEAGTPNAGSGGGVAGGLVAQASSSGLRWAKESYQNATEILNVTKRSIQEPVYKTSKEPAASYVISTSGAIFAYVIDVGSGVARMVKLPVDQETKADYEYHAGKGSNVFESASPPARPFDVSVEEILKKAEGAPTVALTQIAADVAAGRKLFADETAALDKQRAEITSNTLSQLDHLAGKAQDPVAATEGSASTAQASENTDTQCLTDTSSLNDKLKKTGVPMIDEVRDQIVTMDIVSAMRKATDSGVTHSAAIQATIDQVKEFEKSAEDALRTAAQVDASGQSDEAYLAYLERGQIVPKDCEGKRQAAFCTAIVSRMGSLANRLIAHAMTCHDLKGTWPK
jgi:hypothetical protein